MTGDRVAVTVAGGVARIRLIRTDARNAIDPAMVVGLEHAADACAAEPSLRAVLISADGPAFTVGGDLVHLASHRDDMAAELAAIIPGYHRALSTLASLDAPIVAAIQGAIAGGGLGLAWVADIVVAADDAVFASGFARLGLSGDGGSSWFLPRLVGLRRAQELLIGGRVLKADEALEWGLVTRVVPRADLESEAEAEVDRLAQGPTFALAQIRHLLRRSWAATYEEQLAAEAIAMGKCGSTADACEGIAAFTEHRPPTFTENQ